MGHMIKTSLKKKYIFLYLTDFFKTVPGAISTNIDYSLGSLGSQGSRVGSMGILRS